MIFQVLLLKILNEITYYILLYQTIRSRQDKEIIIELSAYDWINWFDNKTLKTIGDSLNKIVTKKTSSNN